MAQAVPATPEDRRFISYAMKAPLLERDEELELARKWQEDGDKVALDRIVTSHIRIVVRLAVKYRGYGLPVSDLIQEGTIGLVQAINRFDRERGVRFSTYAKWWVMAGIQEHVVRNSSLVRIGTTPAQKSLFFNLRRLRALIGGDQDGRMTYEQRQAIASELHVPLAAVERMESQNAHADHSLNAPVGADSPDEAINFLADPRPGPEEIATAEFDSGVRKRLVREALNCLTAREREVIHNRFLTDERSTLEDIGNVFGVTKERIRQIEAKALLKLRDALGAREINIADLTVH